MRAFVGALKMTTDNVNALEQCEHSKFVSFYTRRDVVYVYLETETSIETLRDAWGPSFFIEAAKGVGANWERLVRKRGIECVERGRSSFVITSLAR